MPIKWSALQVSEAMTMAEEFIKEADLPLEQARIVVKEARKIANLPQYLDYRLIPLIAQIEKIDSAKAAIKSAREAIPDGAIEAEQEKLRNGSTVALI